MSHDWLWQSKSFRLRYIMRSTLRGLFPSTLYIYLSATCRRPHTIWLITKYISCVYVYIYIYISSNWDVAISYWFVNGGLFVPMWVFLHFVCHIHVVHTCENRDKGKRIILETRHIFLTCTSTFIWYELWSW